MGQAAQSVLLSSPRFSLQAARQFVASARLHQLRGVRFSVLVAQEAVVPQNQGALHVLRSAGITVHELPQLHECFAVVDGGIVWYGSVHALTRPSAESSMMRLANADIAGELMRTLALRACTKKPWDSPPRLPELPGLVHGVVRRSARLQSGRGGLRRRGGP